MYRGRLKDGTPIAVKVQRPSIGESIAVDMLLLRRLMAVVDKQLPQLGVRRGAGGSWFEAGWKLSPQEARREAGREAGRGMLVGMRVGPWRGGRAAAAAGGGGLGAAGSCRKLGCA